MPTGRNVLLYVLGEWSAIPSDERVLWLPAGVAGLAMIMHVCTHFPYD